MDIPYASISLLKKAFEAGMDSATQYEWGNGELESFNEWYKRMELDNEKHR